MENAGDGVPALAQVRCTNPDSKGFGKVVSECQFQPQGLTHATFQKPFCLCAFALGSLTLENRMQ